MELTVDGRAAYAFTAAKALDPAQDSVVFVHGAGMDHTVWTLPARYFARHGRNVLAVDLPGHGRSPGPPLPSIEAMADWLVRALDAAGIERAALVGHSMGSLVALEVAARYPERTRALVMIGTAVPMAVNDVLLGSAEANDHAAVDMLTVWGYSRHAQLGGNETPGMWMVGGTLRLLERAAPGVIHADLNACNAYRDGAERAAAVTCPALLILGEKDIMTPPRGARNIAANVAGCRITTLKGSGHALLSEQPDGVLDALISIG